MPPAPSAPAAQRAAFSTSVDVETPELVTLTYTIAGPGSRVAAGFLDFVLCWVAKIVVIFGFATLSAVGGLGESSAWAVAALVIVYFVIDWGYYVLFEALSDGQTPGKRALRLRVVRDGGYSVTFGASAVRNLVRIVDMQPFFLYGVGIISLLASRLGKRLGDLAAGTIVVREAIVRRPTAAAPRNASDPAPLHTQLSDEEYGLLDRFIQRFAELDIARRGEFARQLATRFAKVLETVEGDSLADRLARLHAMEQNARARGVAHRSDTGAARERHAIIASGSARWAAFAERLARAQRGGIGSLAEEDARDFVQEYRELTADLARLRTAARGREVGEIFYLNRLAAGAHNLLYRRHAISPADIVRFFFVSVPREIRASATPILIAAGIFFLPMIIAYTAVVRDPLAAEKLLPPIMLDRADDGVRRAQRDDGYIDDPQVLRPVMATGVISNNVQVSIGAFGGGISAGVLTGFILLTNGVSIGSVFGLYASKGIGTLLLAFVAPHGVLELTAICIAGGAGFLLAAALLIPGARTRRTALAENGRRAIRLVAGSTMLLVVAGMIEGFISPIPWWPIEGKLAIAGTTAVLLYVFLRLAPVRARRET